MHRDSKTQSIYKNMSDHQLLIFAEKNYPTLRSEILPILVSELAKRKIGTDVIAKIKTDSDLFFLDEAMIMSKVKEIESLKCPNCKKSNFKLICFVKRSVFSFFVRSIYRKNTIISCKECYRQDFLFSNLSTLLLGWWSLSGLMKTPYSLFQNFMNYLSKEKTLQANIIDYVIENQDYLFAEGIDLEEFVARKNTAI